MEPPAWGGSPCTPLNLEMYDLLNICSKSFEPEFTPWYDQIVHSCNCDPE